MRASLFSAQTLCEMQISCGYAGIILQIWKKALSKPVYAVSTLLQRVSSRGHFLISHDFCAVCEHWFVLDVCKRAEKHLASIQRSCLRKNIHGPTIKNVQVQ